MDIERRRTSLRTTAALTIILIMLFLTRTIQAQPGITIQSAPATTLSMDIGKSIILRSQAPVERVSAANPEIIDFVIISPHQVYMTAKAAGSTRLSLWLEGNGVTVYDVEVGIDIAGLKQRLHEVMPEEGEVRVTSANGSVTLSGRISSASKLSQALALAEAYAPKEKITNLLEVTGVQQVMLEVRVAEMSKSLEDRLGFNFAYASGDDFGVSLLNELTTLVDPDDANVPVIFPDNLNVTTDTPLGLFASPSVNSLFRFNKGSASWTFFIDALKEDGLAKVLAEPTLIALSGQTASFLGGGEFPIPVPQGLGTVAIEYKKFGVELYFTPTVLAENKINIRVEPVVSELDFSTAILIQSFVIPGLTKRGAATTVELGDGQSFAIAGLLNNTERDIVRKFPLLGDLPVVGALFRSQQWQRNETELVIIVTPHLVKPLDMAKQTLPTDFYVPPNAWEWYGLGLTESCSEPKAARVTGDLDGEFGHSIPTPY